MSNIEAVAVKDKQIDDYAPVTLKQVIEETNSSKLLVKPRAPVILFHRDNLQWAEARLKLNAAAKLLADVVALKDDIPPQTLQPVLQASKSVRISLDTLEFVMRRPQMSQASSSGLLFTLSQEDDDHACVSPISNTDSVCDTNPV